MIEIKGQFIFARSTDAFDALLQLDDNWQAGKAVRYQVGTSTKTVLIASISPPEGRKRRLIIFDDGNKFYIPHDQMPAILDTHKWGRRLDKGERSSLLLLTVISVLVSVGIAFMLYVNFLKIADWVAGLIPDKAIAELSGATVESLDAYFFEPSDLSPERQAELQAGFETLRELTQTADNVELLFRKSSLFGANALALPGGPVILLDGLVEIAPSDDGIYGVLAHELAHIEQHHGRRNLARSALFSLIATLSGFSQSDENTAALAQTVLFSGYSREFETDADNLARELMKTAGLDQAAFDEMLRALYETRCGDDCETQATGWFDSHPSLSDRLSVQSN